MNFVRTVGRAGVLSLGLALCVAATGRSVKEIETDILQVKQEISRYGGLEDLTEPKYRRAFHEQLLPTLQHKIELIRELEAAQPSFKASNNYSECLDLAIAATWGDEPSSAALDKAAAESDPVRSEAGKLGQAIRDWWMDPAPEAQAKVLDRVKAMATAKPTDDSVARALIVLADNHPASEQLADDARSVVEKQMKGTVATTYKTTPNRKGCPMIVSGTTIQGKSFSSTTLKGKVVMVDFWATWCPPCREELPHVVSLYKQYHDKGLEIVGISNDNDRKALLAFLKDNPDVKWPQLYAPSSTPSHWNTLSVRCNVNSIPTVYLIDRKGVLRSLTARTHLDEMIPKLLDEQPSAAAQ
ncbi:MAG TPA: TlpA disulfide reductase family protein [Tepidisphaeraceae bacterium]|nr:TlpA disulfide reductase family protein [Tepidisphaeraceae bacterium]